MVDETVAFLDAVVGARAHLVGWSDGAVVAARVAARSPQLVDRLVLVRQYLSASPPGPCRSRPVGALLVDFLRGGPHELDLSAALEQEPLGAPAR